MLTLFYILNGTSEMDIDETIEETGSCQCGAIKFKVSGNVMFNALCHCKACSHNRGMSPVHLIGVTPPSSLQLTEGHEHLKLAKGYGKMRHKFCSKCGCIVYQYPKHANFRAILPTNFHLEAEDGIDCRLPEEYTPKAQVNYENRHQDYHDDLPKFKEFPPHKRLDNSGYDIHLGTFY